MEQEIQLQKNREIETAIAALQKEPTEEMLAHALTAIRRRLRERGRFLVSLDQKEGDGTLQMRAISTSDGRNWFTAFTSFEEQLKGSNAVMSAFTADIDQLFRMTLEAEGIEGLILNPWHRTIMLDKQLIQIVMQSSNV